MQAHRTKATAGYTFIELMVVIFIIGILLALLLPAVQRVRAANQRTTCGNNLKQIGLAILTAHDVISGLLPSRLEDPVTGTNTGQATWGILLMPYIEQDVLYKRWDLTQTYNNQNQARFLPGSLVPMYYCPARRPPRLVSMIGAGQLDTVKGGLSDYAAVGGDDGSPSGIWSTDQTRAALAPADCSQGLDRWVPRTRLASLIDGASNTALIGEKHVVTQHFGDSAYGDSCIFSGASPSTYLRVAGPAYPLAQSPSDSTNASLRFGSYHIGICQFVMGDGRVLQVSNYASGTLLSRMMIRDDGLSLPVEDY
jgi:prepilin-type N-terminal cleavage/methylation domain-containing protein